MRLNPKNTEARNQKIIDTWSFIHLASAAILCILFGPIFALLVTFLWEPLEIFIISPLAAKFGYLFGHESWQNVASDLVFDGIGVLVALSLI